MQGYVSRLMRGNVRLIVLAAVTAVSFILTEFWRDSVERKSSEANALALMIDGVLQRFAMAERQLTLQRAVVMTESGTMLTGRADLLTKFLTDPSAQRFDYVEMSADEQWLRLQTVYGDDLASRREEFLGLFRQIGGSDLLPREMKTIEDVAMKTGKTVMEGCIQSFWSDAPPAVAAGLRQFDPIEPPKSFPRLAEQLIFLAEENKRLVDAHLAVMVGFIDWRKAHLAAAVTPEEKSRSTAIPAAGAFRMMAIYGTCIDVLSRSHLGNSISFLGSYRFALFEHVRRLAVQLDWIRYLSYLVAILAFVAGNIKPPKPLEPPGDSDLKTAPAEAAEGRAA
jgi:hypothetical protein